ncbi:MAG TPA: alpha/beta fold hydrolase [Actinomycetota bacterium]
MTAAPARAAAEEPLFFDAGGITLFGILTEPARANGKAVVMLSGGGATAPATNRNRLSVHLCRRLGAQGYHAFRFDYHGIGESDGVLAGAPRVDEPYLTDVAGAVGCIRDRGLERFVLVGSCFGARTALAAAPSIDGLEALVLVSPPLRDLELGDEAGTRLALTLGARESIRRAARVRTIRGLFHPARRRAYARFIAAKARGATARVARALTRRRGVDDRWLGEEFLHPIEQLAARGVPVVFIYGTEDHHYHDWLLAEPGRLGALLARAPLTELQVMEGSVHGLTSIDVQERVADAVAAWIEQLDRRGRP